MPDIEPINIDALQNRFDAVATDAAPEVNDKNTYSFEELWELRDDEQKFLIPELLPKHAVAVLIGEDGIGKTQITTQLCLHIALGYKTFLNLELNADHNRCLIVATEDSKQKFTKALVKQALALNPNINPKEVHIDFTEGGNFDDLNRFLAELDKNLKAHKYELVIIDALSDLFTLIDGEINSNTHARFILNKLQYLSNHYLTTILLIHHAAKTKIFAKLKDGKLFVEKSDAQGAGAITQKPRTVLALTHDPRTLTNNGATWDNFLHVVKANLMGKFYVSNALRVAFDGTTLLHNFRDLTDIKLYETNNNGNGDGGGLDNAPFNIAPVGIDYNEHRRKMIEVFKGVDKLQRPDLLKRMKTVYGCGVNKIEETGGYLHQVTTQGIISKDGRGYVLKIIQDEIDKQTNMNFNADEDAPF